MKPSSDFLKKIIGNLFAEKQTGEQGAGLFLPVGLLHDAHTVVLDELGDGDFPGHFQKRKILLLTPEGDLLRYSGKIAPGIDDDSGAAGFFHGGNEPEKPSLRPRFHAGGYSELRSAETADDGLVLHHMDPAHHAVHTLFSGQKAKLILIFGFFKDFPETNCHRIFPLSFFQLFVRDC